MSIQLLQQGPPPYVTFEQRAEEDRDETIKAGRLVMKDVDYAIIYRHGSKDSVEVPAEGWLDDLDKKSREHPPKIPVEWAKAFRERYQQWKGGLEMTPMGFPIRQWAAISKAQAENLVLARVLTVENLAQASEEVLSKIGIGARALKEKAIAWLESSKGNTSEEMAALRAQNADLLASQQAQSQKIQELEAAIMALQPQNRKRA